MFWQNLESPVEQMLTTYVIYHIQYYEKLTNSKDSTLHSDLETSRVTLQERTFLPAARSIPFVDTVR